MRTLRWCATRGSLWRSMRDRSDPESARTAHSRRMRKRVGSPTALSQLRRVSLATIVKRLKNYLIITLRLAAGTAWRQAPGVESEG